MIWKAPVRSGEMQVAELATGTDSILLYNWKAPRPLRLRLEYFGISYKIELPDIFP